MTQHDVYSIDPDGCEDADDAFSIYREDDKLFLAIHIADPTEYIQLNSPLWKDMEIRSITRYPSNNPPIHMMPHDIMEKASLMDNRHGCIKSAVTVTTEIEKNTFQPIGQIKLLYKIQVKRETLFHTVKQHESFIIVMLFIYVLKYRNRYNHYEKEKQKQLFSMKLQTLTLYLIIMNLFFILTLLLKD